jgi:hypothetical protein
LKFTAPRLFGARPGRTMLIFSTETEDSNHHKEEILISRSSKPWPAAPVSAIDGRYFSGQVRGVCSVGVFESEPEPSP